MANKTMIDIYCPNWSKGLSVSANVIKKGIERASTGQLQCRILWASEAFYAPEKQGDPPPRGATELGRVAIFVERLFTRSYLGDYASRIFVPNPEWLDPDATALARDIVDVFLHKSNFSLGQLGPLFPGAAHHLIGFTSPDPGMRVRDHQAFSHFRGKATTRFTQPLIDLWQRRPDFPPLSIQAYGRDIGLRLQDWVTTGNVNLLLNYYESDERYFADLSRGGIHLCTSAVEGFGHYINESRAMGALILTLDGPPMNELVTPDSGILIATTGSLPMNQGMLYETSETMIEKAVEHALSLDPAKRQRLGQRARLAYEEGRQAFAERLERVLRHELALIH